MKLALFILDGYGIPISSPFIKKLSEAKTYNNFTISKTKLGAAEKYVGLPKGFMGNSEVGHLNLGSGRDFKQIITRINDSIKNKTLQTNSKIVQIKNRLDKNSSAIHLIGMYSESGVHSHLNHLIALIKIFKNYRIKLHIITDGRDTKPKSCREFIKKIRSIIEKKKNIEIASICGRYYAMDRDHRWSRTKRFYNLLNGKGTKSKSVLQVISHSYKSGIYDEFIQPHRMENYTGLEKNDELLFFNFRSDRMRQIVSSFENNFKEFKQIHPKVNITTIYKYDKKIKYPSVFDKLHLENTLSEVLAKNKMRQLKIAETEKYAHVTYFFNGGNEKQYPKEKRVIIPSPKVSTYDKSPNMSADKIVNYIIENKNKFDIIIANIANPDMVGHTGNKKATKLALKKTDECIKKLIEELNDYKIIITADHGNCELMTGRWKKSHTLSKVPFILLDRSKHKIKHNSANALKNVAPTILKLLKIKKPKEMNQKSLI